MTNWLDRLVRFREDRRNPMPVTWLIAALGYPLPFVLGAVFALGLRGTAGVPLQRCWR